MITYNISLGVLKRQLDQRKLVDANIHNLAKSIFRPGVRVQWRVNAREYYGEVIEVSGEPGETHVHVVNMATKKNRDLQLADITGLVQEN